VSAPLAGTTALLRPLRPRDPTEAHRVASPLELLTDLCFVVAVAQIAGVLHHAVSADHVGDGLLHFAMVFFAIWWAWLNFTWFASAYDNDDVGYRLLTIVQIVGSLVLAAGVESMAAGDFTLGVVGYVIMRIALVGQWLRAARADPVHRITCRRYAVGVLVVQLFWVLLLLVRPDSGSASSWSAWCSSWPSRPSPRVPA
jgi:low temperature requirement protein LtrA